MISKFIDPILFLLMSSTISYAEILSAEPEKDKNNVEVANVYYTAKVDDKSVAELGAVLKRISANYTSVKNINLIINSPGGEASAGFLAYSLVKSSPIPIRTINGGMTASAATFIFCAANEHVSLPRTTFLLHAPSDAAGRVKPDEIKRLQKELDTIIGFMKPIYKQCTTLSDTEIETITKAEYFSEYLSVDQALNIKMIQNKIENIPASFADFYIVSS